MIAYTKDGLQRLWMIDQCAHALHSGSMSEKDSGRFKTQFPSLFYTPNVFIRIGLFLLTYIAGTTVAGFLGIFMGSMNNNRSMGFLSLVMGVLSLIALELFIRKSRHFKSGVDNALLLMSFSFIMLGLNLAAGDFSLRTNTLIVMGLTFAFTLRYINYLIAAAFVIAFFVFSFDVLSKWGDHLKTALPFAFLLLSAAIMAIAERTKDNYALRFYRDALLSAQVTAMLILLASGNYYVVEQVENQLFSPKPSTLMISLGWLFWILTFLIPLSYLFSGIYRKDVVHLRLGLLALPFLFMTYWHYYQPISLEWTLTLKGAALILLVYFLIRYLHKARHGITSHKISGKKLQGIEQIEALIAADAMGGSPQSPMGGGTSGGAGASGSF